MINIFINDKEKFSLHVLNPNNSIKVQVNSTILTWCIDLRDDKILNSISNESREQLKNGKQGVVTVAILDQNNTATIKGKCTCIMQENVLRINLSQSLRLALQRLFPISSAIAICKNKGKKFPISLKSDFLELIEVIPVVNESPENSGFILKADRICTSAQLKNVTSDLGLLAELIEKFMASGAFTVTAQNGKRNLGYNDNTVVSSTVWKPATEYGEAEKALTNCIYYLSNEDNEKIKKVYVGEAVVIGKRVITKKINGIIYIGHRNDIEINKFTRYRIDRLAPNTTRDTLHHAQDAIIGGLTMMDNEEFPNGFALTNLAYNSSYNSVKKQRKHKK